MKGTLTIRMYVSSLKKIKKSFPAKREETMVSYFNRLAVHLEMKNIRYIDSAIIDLPKPKAFKYFMKGGKHDTKNN